MGVGPRNLHNPAWDFTGVCNYFLSSITLRIFNDQDYVLNNVVITEPTTWRELVPSGGNVIRIGKQFIWPRRFTPIPPIGSIIIDGDGIYYTVWQNETKDWVETHEPKCLSLNITPRYWNRALILKGQYTHGDAGEAKATWYGYFSGQDPPTQEDTVRAHFQPSEESARIEFGGEWSRETYLVYFEKPVPKELAGSEFRLVDSHGFRYRIEKYYDELQISKLPTAIAVRITEGVEYFQNGVPPTLAF